jgi:hypothetical protein
MYTKQQKAAKTHVESTKQLPNIPDESKQQQSEVPVENTKKLQNVRRGSINQLPDVSVGSACLTADKHPCRKYSCKQL